MDELQLVKESLENRLEVLEEKTETELTEINRQMKAMWNNLDNLKKVSNESLILAKHADKGYIEIYTELKNLKSNFEKIEETNKKIEKLVHNMPSLISDLELNLTNKLGNNIRWVIGIIISFLAIIGIITKG